MRDELCTQMCDACAKMCLKKVYNQITCDKYYFKHLFLLHLINKKTTTFIPWLNCLFIAIPLMTSHITKI